MLCSTPNPIRKLDMTLSSRNSSQLESPKKGYHNEASTLVDLFQSLFNPHTTTMQTVFAPKDRTGVFEFVLDCLDTQNQLFLSN